MEDEVEKYILDTYKLKIVFSNEAIDLMVEYNKMFEEIVISCIQEIGFRIPFPEIYVVDKDEIGGLEFTYDNKYYILIYSGTISKQRLYLQNLFEKRKKIIDNQYIDKLIKYTIMFLIMHEYMHIYCGHCLKDKSEKIAQEVEADIEATTFMIRKVINDTEDNCCEEELINSFVAIFYLFKSIEKQIFNEEYNIKLLENYYNPKNRDHPLTSQRIMCIYRYFNVFLYRKEEKQFSNIRNGIISRLIELGEKKTENNHIDMLYKVGEQSINDMENSIKELRIKIPRIGNVEE